MRPCSIGKRHKWTHIKNVILQSGSMRIISLSKRGLYRCECGQTKYGEPRMKLEGGV